jgi:SAM-dependent methyltransferase
MDQQKIKTTTSPSEIYERFIVPAIFARWSRVLLELVAPQPGDRVLDLACGTGIVARTAAPMVQPAGEVVGLDFNPAQIATARSIDPSIEWREGDAGYLPFMDQEFDLIVCQQGLQFFPDRVQAVTEMHRVLKLGGRIGISVWSSQETRPGHFALAHALERRMGPSTAGAATAPTRCTKGPFPVFPVSTVANQKTTRPRNSLYGPYRVATWRSLSRRNAIMTLQVYPTPLSSAKKSRRSSASTVLAMSSALAGSRILHGLEPSLGG